jgi:hypothetical protein
MGITQSFTSPAKLFDPIRKRWVIASPEERVRQSLVRAFLEQGVPSHWILVEAALQQLVPALVTRTRFRFDAAIAPTDSNGIHVLLLAECKAKNPDHQACKQLLRYHSLCGGRYLLLAGPEQIWNFDRLNPAGVWELGMPILDLSGFRHP